MFENMRLGTKFVAGFIVVAIISLIIGGIGVFNMSQMDNYVHKLYDKDLLGLSYIKEVKINSLYISRDWRAALLEPDSALVAKNTASVKNNIDLFKENFSKGSALFYTDDAKKIIKEINGMIPEWEHSTLQMVAIIEANNLTERTTPEFDAIRAVQHPLSKAMNERIDQLSRLKEVLAEKTVHDSADLYSYSLIVLILLIAVGFITSIFIGIAFSRYVMRQLGGELTDAIEQVRRVSAGNLNSTITLQPRDSSSLLYALKAMQETI
ncbi:MAG: MCP four helix bundle domain-containing protein, partial [Methylococcales bacterium]|nr:MCP four helix bundle domain-containing protein [Methylococcales bacterium]